MHCATIVSRSILERAAPILVVCHDADDHGWQFLDGASEDIDDLAIIGLGHILEIDPSMTDLAHLQPGFEATRQSEGAAWVVQPIPPESED